MRKLIITVGLPGSGKTTWALEQIELGKADVRVNRDDLRMALYGKYFLEGYQERHVTRVQHDAISTLLAQDLTVIVDDTNLNRKTRTLLRELAERCQASFEANDTFLFLPTERCKEWATLRAVRGGRNVPGGVIDGMAKRYASLVGKGTPDDEAVRRHFGVHELRNRKGTPAILVDIDGTIADHNGRDPFDVAKCSEDLLYDDVADVVMHLAEESELIFLSGRDSKYRDLTLGWLKRQGFRNFRLFMRAEDDKRSDEIIKYEIYEEQILPGYDVFMVFDDRDRVVKMWRSIGLTCAQVNYGSF